MAEGSRQGRIGKQTGKNWDADREELVPRMLQECSPLLHAMLVPTTEHKLTVLIVSEMGFCSHVFI